MCSMSTTIVEMWFAVKLMHRSPGSRCNSWLKQLRNSYFSRILMNVWSRMSPYTSLTFSESLNSAFSVRSICVRRCLRAVKTRSSTMKVPTAGLMIVLATGWAVATWSVSLELRNEEDRHGRPMLPPFLGGKPEDQQVRQLACTCQKCEVKLFPDTPFACSTNG